MTLESPDHVMPTSSSLEDLMPLADSKYVLFTTFRRSGIGVPTPVWIARDADTLVFTTSVQSGKVRRLRADGDVLLQACDRIGVITDGAPIVAAHAIVVEDPAGLRAGIGAVIAKYREEATRLIGGAGDRNAATRVVIRITPRS